MIWLCVAIYISTGMGPLTKEEDHLDPEHPRIVVFTKLEREFPLYIDHKPRVVFLWGTEELD